MDNQYPWWVSSTGQGVAQRIISFIALIYPVLSAFGLHIAVGDINTFVVDALVVVFGVWQVWAWARVHIFKQLHLGKFAPKQ